MKKIRLPLSIACLALLGLASCDSQKVIPSLSKTDTLPPPMKHEELANHTDNVLLRPSTLQFQAPEFDKIKDSDFEEAFNIGLSEARADINKIVENTAAPTLENTLEAIEKSGINLKRAQTIFYNLTSANTNPTLQALQEKYAPIFSAFTDEMYLNSKLYQRIKDIPTSNLSSEDLRLKEYYLENFEIAGAALPDAKKEELKKLNQELAIASTQFGNILLESRKNAAVVVDTPSELAGLSAEEIAAAADLAKKQGSPGKYMIAIQNTTQQPVISSLENRALREKIFKASINRASKGDANDTRQLVLKLANLRQQKAALLGQESYAAWKLQDQMAKTVDAAQGLLKKLAQPAIKQAKEEEKVINSYIKKEGKKFSVQPWDWSYYSEKVRKEKYDLDEAEIKPYFEVINVLENGVFYAAEQFYGISFKKRPDLPVYHPDVVAYEVFDREGKSLAIYYLDFYTRSSKNGGAWMSNFVEQSHLSGTKPVIVNCFNYQKPAPGKPSLIAYDDVETMFHEFGHSIHGMFADQKYPSLSGTNVPRDFVEFPSQINEHFALEPTVLRNYAKHFQTGAPMPEVLIQKIKAAKNFNQGFMTTEIVSAAQLDMDWHSMKNIPASITVEGMEKQSLDSNGFSATAVPPRYSTPYFAHIWGGGYSAGYYAYLWSETLDSDAWEWIKQNGGLTRENGDRFRKYILSVGNSKNLNDAYKEFSGRNPSVDPLLRMRGFIK